MSLLTTPDLYLIDPSQPNATLVHSFPSVLGPIRDSRERHVLHWGRNITASTLHNMPQSYAVWKIDMRSFSQSSGKLVRKVTYPKPCPSMALPHCQSHNPDRQPDLRPTVVWKVDVHGSYAIVNSDPSMAKVVTSPLHNRHKRLQDSSLSTLFHEQEPRTSVPGPTTGKAKKAVKIFATGLRPDDFALDSRGMAWGAQYTANVVSVVLRTGTVADVVGATDQLTWAGPTAREFGRARGGTHLPTSALFKGQEKRDMLNCCTTEGLASPVNGTVVEEGKVVVIDTEWFERGETPAVPHHRQCGV